MNRRMNRHELRSMVEGMGQANATRMIADCLERGRTGQPGGLRASDFSVRDIAEATCGRDWVESLDPSRGVSVLESGAGVSTTAFSNITGQLLVSAVLEAYESEEFVFSNAFRTISTRLSGERIPGIGGIGDKAEGVGEMMPYPHVGVGEDYIDTPATTKDGLIVPVSKEAVFFDRTGLLLERCSQVGEALGLRKEKACIDVFVGAVNNHKWKGTSYNTYQAATPWINTLSGATYALVDWTQVGTAESLFDNMLDPNTGEPVLVGATTLVGTSAAKYTIDRILNATEVRHITNTASIETASLNPLRSAGYSGLTSRLLHRRLVASGKSAAEANATWFLGNIAKAFAYMENLAITVAQAPSNSEVEFTHDIVARFKASEQGVPVAYNPRYIVKVNGHA